MLLCLFQYNFDHVHENFQNIWWHFPKSQVFVSSCIVCLVTRTALEWHMLTVCLSVPSHEQYKKFNSKIKFNPS